MADGEAGVPLGISDAYESAHFDADAARAAAAQIGERPDASALHLLLALRREAPEVYRELAPELRARVLVGALRDLPYLNDFGWMEPDGHGHDRTAAQALLELGDAARRRSPAARRRPPRAARRLRGGHDELHLRLPALGLRVPLPVEADAPRRRRSPPTPRSATRRSRQLRSRAQATGTCCVMQCTPPPPSASVSPGTATASRPGYSDSSSASASASVSSPRVGTIRPPLQM